jgi:hypothetical protein
MSKYSFMYDSISLADGGALETPSAAGHSSENMAWRARVTAVRVRVLSLKDATTVSLRPDWVTSCIERQRWETTAALPVEHETSDA